MHFCVFVFFIYVFFNFVFFVFLSIIWYSIPKSLSWLIPHIQYKKITRHYGHQRRKGKACQWGWMGPDRLFDRKPFSLVCYCSSVLLSYPLYMTNPDIFWLSDHESLYAVTHSNYNYCKLYSTVQIFVWWWYRQKLNDDKAENLN